MNFDNIQQEIKQLSQRQADIFQKQVELSEVHQESIKSHEEQKTPYQLDQPPQQPHPEIISEIAHLDRLKEMHIKTVQPAASSTKPSPETDWSKLPLYWNRLTKYGLVTPIEQINAYTFFVGGIIGLGYAGSYFYRAHHLFKITHFEENTEEWIYHWARAIATPQQIKMAPYWIGIFKLRGCAALGAPLLFIGYLWSKRTSY